MNYSLNTKYGDIVKDAFAELYSDADGDVTDDELKSYVSELAKNNRDTEEPQEFAALVYAAIQEDSELADAPEAKTKGNNYLYRAIKTGETADTDIDAEIAEWIAAQYKDGATKILEEGYYLIIEKTSAKPEVFSRAILQTVGIAGHEIRTKEEVPTVSKQVDDDGIWAKRTDAGIGSTVKFLLIGEVANGFDTYTSNYKYMFTDTMSQGLTFNPDETLPAAGEMLTDTSEETAILRVFISSDNEVNAGDTEITTLFKVVSEIKMDDPATEDKDEFNDNPDYAVTYSYDTDKKETTLQLAITDLKDLKTKYGLSADKKILVLYKARVNEAAVIGGSGDLNTVHIDYSNDPHTIGMGKSKEDEVKVYTFQINVIKMNQQNVRLEDAEFVLYRKTTGGKEEYAIWDNEGKLEGWTENYLTEDGDYYVEMENGEVLGNVVVSSHF